MDPEQWQRLEPLLDQALELAPEERETYVQQTCGDSAQLRAQLRALIAECDGDSGFLEQARPVAEDARRLALERVAAPAAAELLGQRLGPYKIVRVLGEGGLSTVYLGERSDQQFTMRVAIKVVKRGMDTADILRRLRQERQILASLDHPNIARLFDGGTTGDGLPYFVMEHIEGEPIDRYCDRRALPVAERLEFFRTACSAVHAAHQNLIIHRDLKPSNLLVTTDGVPKLLDFGIAKLLGPDREDLAARTVTGMRLLTPEYASPEQVLGQPLTTATDVYSLGVMLYRLLTGHRPYRFDAAQPAAIERVICGTDPTRPSTVIGRRPAPDASGKGPVPTPETVSRARGGTPDKLRRRLAGDLDNIVLMALRKEPQRRYASVDELSRDIGRHLESRPVRARKDTLAYLASRFVVRHRGAVAAGTLVLLALIVGIVTTTWQALVARDARATAERHLEEARTQSARAEQVSAFLVDIFEISDPGEAKGNQVTAREILDQGADKIRLELGDQPELKAQLMTTIGRVYRNLGLLGRAKTVLEEVLENRRQRLGDEHPGTARSLTRVAEIDFERGELEVAEEELRGALASQRRLLGNEHLDVAVTLNQLATVLDARADAENAERLYSEALEMRRRLLGADHLEVVEILNNLAELHYANGRWDDAETLFRQALASRQRQLGDDHLDVAVSFNNLAATLSTKGDHEAAEPLFRRVLELRLRILGEEHPEVAISLNNLAATLQALDRHAEAEELLRQALAINRKLFGPGHPLAAANQTNLAVSLHALGQDGEAEELFLAALGAKRRLYGDEHPDVTLSLYKLADFYADLDRAADAEPLLAETLRIQRKILPTGDFRLSYPLVALARLLAGRGEQAAAEPLAREAVTIRRQVFPDGHPDRVEAEDLLQACLEDLGDLDP